MIFFITFLRALAACLITNSHYTGVYPTDIIASGGLIGDILFFAVSGYCLYNVRGNFPKWYGKRLYRCYLPVIIITIVYMILGFYKLNHHSLLWWFVYPTEYHFVSSIVILYIPYFIILKVNALKKRIPQLMICIGVAAFAVYILWVDKTVYNIDGVRNQFIKFLFMESLLLGAYFKQNDQKFRNKFSPLLPIGTFVAFVAYFASKLAFSSYEKLAPFQILNQIIIFVLLYLLFRLFASLDSKLAAFPQWLKSVINFIASMTLEIYVVQSVLINLLKNIAPFPLNWIAITAAIVLAAFILHILCKSIIKFTDRLGSKAKNAP